MNSLLKRQIRRYLKEDIPEHYERLFNAISQSYDHYEDDRDSLDRAMAISSRELNEAFEKLKKDTEQQRRIVSGLKDAIDALNDLGVGEKINVENLDGITLTKHIEKQAFKIKKAESELLLLKQFFDLSSDLSLIHI